MEATDTLQVLYCSYFIVLNLQQHSILRPTPKLKPLINHNKDHFGLDHGGNNSEFLWYHKCTVVPLSVATLSRGHPL